MYTFMEALGDFGGFNDGIIFIPAILMQIYSQKMYLQHLFKLLPIKRAKNPSDRKKIRERFSQDSSLNELSKEDAEMLAEESGRLQLSMTHWLLNLCFVKCLCRKAYRMRLQERAIEQFENSLDIRSIVKTRIDLSILLRSLLSKEQLLLFRNQHARAFIQYDSANEKMEPEPIEEHEDGLLAPDFVLGMED